MYRGYSRDVPGFIVNRPRSFAKHCKEKMKNAADIDKTDIKSTDIEGVFLVKSESLSKTWYRVQSGDNYGTLLSCECRSW